MDKLKYVKLEQEDGSYSEAIPIVADSDQIDINDETLTNRLNKTPYYYNTVASMKADTKLKNGDMAITLGYYTANDGGGAEYKIVNGNYTDDGGNYHELNNGLFAELIIRNEVNIKQFGAYGDGEHDDTDIIQNAINIAISIAKTLIFPTGTYIISNTLSINTNGTLNHSSIVISGIERQSSVIKVKTNSNLSSLFNITSSSGHTRNLVLSHLYLHGNNTTSIGINIDNAFSESLLQDIKIEKCTDYGIKGVNNFYLTTLDKCTIYNSNHGIYIYGGVNTSLNLKDCYCNNCAYGYKVSGIYNTMQNCCADGTSQRVFDFSGFKGSAIGCGSECTRALEVFYAAAGTCNVTIVGAYTWGNFTDAEAVHINANNSIMTFIGGNVAVNWNEFDYPMPGALYIHGAYGVVNFINTKYSKYTIQNTGSTDRNTSLAETHINRYGITKKRGDWSGLSYIGTDGFLTSGKIDAENEGESILSNAIFFGFGDNRNTTADGKDIQWSAHNSKGDIVLSRNPENIGGIGWIQSVDNSSTPSANWKNGNYYKIPIIFSEISTNRISTPSTGQMMFDKTLGKPIWYDGSKWVDSTGTDVSNT